MPSQLRLYFAAAYYRSYLGTFRWSRPSVYLAQKVILPLAQLTFFVFIGMYAGAYPLDFYLVGNAIAVAGVSSLYYVARAVASEKREGTLPYVLASPAARIPIFLGSGAFQTADAAVSVAMAFAWASLVFGLRLSWDAAVELAVVVAVATVALSGLGLLLGAISYVLWDADLVANVAIFGVLLLTGANIPLNDLPAPVAALGALLPPAGAIEAARVVARGGPLTVLPGLLAHDLALGALYAALGAATFHALEQRARNAGALEGF
jgi:ABC-2 type transport system permease protein